MGMKIDAPITKPPLPWVPPGKSAEVVLGRIKQDNPTCQLVLCIFQTGAPGAVTYGNIEFNMNIILESISYQI